MTRIITHPTEIWRILTGIGWPTTTPEFDESQDLTEWYISQLEPETADGFPVFDDSHTSGSDPPECQFSENCVDPPHWEDSNYITYD